MKLFVGNLSYEITSTDLRAFFAQIGSVVTARVVTDMSTGHSRGFGFVEMSNVVEAKRAIDEFNGMEAIGRTLVVSPAQSR